MSIEDYAERQRLERAAKAKRIAARQAERAQFYASGGVQSAGQQPTPSTTLSNGPLRIGQSTPVLRAGGIVQHDTSSRRQLDEPLNPVSPKGDVAVLAIVRVVDGTWQVWLGGDRPTPVLVMGGLQNSPSAYLDLLGPGKNDWCVGIGWKQGAALETYAIAVRYGKQDPDNERTDWQILDNPGCQHLRYYGMGFWCSNAFNYPAFNFLNSSSTPFPDPINRPPGLGVYTKSGYHGQTGGESTHSVEYWENASISGALSASVEGGTTRSGFIAYVAPLTYTGTNSQREMRLVTAEWEGAASGPGYLGPENTACNLSDPIITGTAFAPRRNQTALTTTEIQLNTQSFSFSAKKGVFTASIGSHTYNYLQTQRSDYKFVADTYRRLDYLARCQEYTSPNAQLWSIGITSFEEWPRVDTVNSVSVSDRTSMLSNQYEVAPGVVKTHGFEFLQRPSQAAQATAYYWSPNAVIFSGKCYSLSETSGAATISSDTSGRPDFYGSPTTASTTYLEWKGSNLLLTNPLDTYQQTWIDKSDSPYPTGFRANYQPYDRLPNGQIKDIDQNNIFKKSKVNFDISKSTGRLVAGKITFDEVDLPQTKIALSMKAVRAIAKTGTSPSVVDIKYWRKIK